MHTCCCPLWIKVRPSIADHSEVPNAETDMQTLSRWLELSAPGSEPCIDNIIKLIYSPGHFNHITVPAAFKCNCIWGQGTPLVLCFGNSIHPFRGSESCRANEGDPEHLGRQAAHAAMARGYPFGDHRWQLKIHDKYLRNCVFMGKSSWIFIALFDYQRALSSDFYFIIFPSSLPDRPRRAFLRP